MIGLFLDAIGAPAPGWPGRRRYIARQVWRLLIEGTLYVLLVVTLLALVVLTAAATDTLPR